MEMSSLKDVGRALQRWRGLLVLDECDAIVKRGDHRSRLEPTSRGNGGRREPSIFAPLLEPTSGGISGRRSLQLVPLL